MAIAMVSGMVTAVIPVPEAQAAPGTPGVPQEPTPVFTETFGTASTVNTPIPLTQYRVGGSPAYTADSEWLPPLSGRDASEMKGTCNGWVLHTNSPLPPTNDDYGCYRSGHFMWDQLQWMAREIGLAQGMTASQAATNNILSASTNRASLVNGAGYMLKSTRPLATVQGGRFYGVSAWFAAVNCEYMQPGRNPAFHDPKIQFELFAGSQTYKLSSDLNPCTAANKTVSSDGKVVVSHLQSQAIFLGTGTYDLGMSLYNYTAHGSGNDAAFDTPEIVDMTPQLDQQFIAPSIPLGSNSNWTFTVTNTTEKSAKNGWNFSVPVPAGITLAGAATTTCSAGNITTTGNKVTASGNLTSGQTSCTFTVPVTVAADGSYPSPASAFTVWGLNKPGDANLSTSRITLTASVAPSTVATAGTSVTYTFGVTNNSGVAVSGLTVTAAGNYTGTTAPGFSGTGNLGAITCAATTVAAGATTNCTATYALTQADIDAGVVNLTARASATAAGASTPTQSNPASAAVASTGRPELTMTATSPGTMTAPGESKTFTFNVTNSGNTTITGLNINRVNFTGNSTPPTFTCVATTLAPGASTTCSGSYTVNAADLAQGEVSITAEARGTSGTNAVTSNRVTTKITYVTDGPDPSKSKLEVDRTTQEVGLPVVATATIVDVNNVPLSGITVDLTLNRSATFGAAGAARVPADNCLTGADGKCSVTFTDTVAEAVQIRAFVETNSGPAEISNSPLTVTFTAGAIDFDKSDFKIDPVVSATDTARTNWRIANGTSAYQGILEARDRYDNPIPNLVVNTIHFTSSDTNVNISAVVNQGNGNYTVNYTSRTVNHSATAAVAVGTTKVQSNQFNVYDLPIPFTVGGPVIECAPGVDDCTNISANPNRLPVGEQSTITAHVTDYNGFPTPGVVVTFWLTPGSDGVLSATTATTNASGNAVVYLDDETAEIVRVSGSFVDDAGDTLTIPPSPIPVEFTVGPFDWDRSQFDVSPVVSATDPAKTGWIRVAALESDGRYYTGTLTAMDAYGNRLTNLSVSDIVFSASSAAVMKSATVTAVGDGTYTIHYWSKVADSAPKASVAYQARAVANSTLGELLPIPFREGPPVPEPPPCEDPTRSGTNLSASPLSLQVTETSNAVALITDEFCNPVPGVTVTFSVSPSSPAVLNVVNAVTDADGKAYATVTDTKAETVALSAKIMWGTPEALTDINNSPLNIVFRVGGFSFEKSTFVVTPVVTADRASWITVAATEAVALATPGFAYTGLLTAMDDNENRLDGLTLTDIKFLVADSHVNVTAIQAIGNGTGEYRVHYWSRWAIGMTSTTTATYQDTQVGTAKPIPFKAGAPDPDPDCDDPARPGTNLSATPLELRVTEISTATAFITDALCNPVPDVPVTFGVDPATATLNVTQGITDEDGNAFATVTSTVPGTVKVSAAIMYGTPAVLTQIHNSPVSILFRTGDLDPSKSSFEVFITDPAATEVVADGVESWTGRLIAKDSQENLLSGLDTSRMNFTGTPAGVTISAVADKGNGNYEVTYTSTVARQYTVALTYSSAKIGTDKTIEFVAGAVDATKSKVTVEPSEQVVGQPVTITVKVRDYYDNPIKNLSASDFVITGKAAGVPDLTIWGFVEEAAGDYTYQATSKLVGDFTVRATVKGVLLNDAPHVVFVHGDVCVNNCEPVDPTHITRFEMVDNDQVADGVAKDSAKAWAYDTYGNVVPGARVVVEDESTGVLAGFLKPPTQETLTGADGTAMVYWTSTKAGTFTARGSMNGLRPPATNVLNQIRFGTGLADPAKSEMVITPASPIVVGNYYTVTVTIRDTNMNPVNNQAVAFSLNPTTPAELSANFCNTDASGVCSVTVTSKLITTVAVRATVPKNGVPTDLGGNGDPAKASPQSVTFIAGPVCVENCTPVDPTHITRVEVVIDGVTANGIASDVAQVFAYDRYGNPVANAPVNSTTTASALTIVTPFVPTAANGETSIEYRSTTSGAYVAKVTIAGLIPVKAISFDGTETKDGSITLNFGFGAADPAHSFLTIDPTTPQVVGSDFVVTAHLNDVNDNPVDGARITFPAVTWLEFSETYCDSNAQGLCSVTVTSKVAGTYTISGRLGSVPVSNTVQAVFRHGPVCVVDCDPVFPGNLTVVKVTTDGRMADGIQRNNATV
ncbi:MAG: Ig-like domain-containing protein [Propionibacteriaceae bacterium]|nr:Ig-like domain-containing protein [Propionibacteriaceae bacterium]